MKHIETLNRLSQSHGPLRPGELARLRRLRAGIQYAPDGFRQLRFSFVWKG